MNIAILSSTPYRVRGDVTVPQNRRSAGGGRDAPRHLQAVLSRSELVTIGVLYAMKNVSRRAFYHWLKDKYGDLFPAASGGPERTRLFRRLEAKSCWTGCFLAQPAILGVADSYGIELGPPQADAGGTEPPPSGQEGQVQSSLADF